LILLGTPAIANPDSNSIGSVEKREIWKTMKISSMDKMTILIQEGVRPLDFDDRTLYLSIILNQYVI
jgi:hypothetical protein